MQPLHLQVGTSQRPPVLGGRYAVVRMLGKGAQARVYLAWDRRTRAWGAIKVLRNEFLEDAEIRARFEREAHTMARLQHPHLLRVFDVGADGQVPWITMELASGGAVTQWIRRNGVMPAPLAAAVTLQAAQGLEHAHRKGVIHRDVKPHNLLIVDRQRVVMTDFGVAHAADASMTATGTVMGTFAYMAPEQRNDSKSVDGRADVYSLGASLYSLLTGQPSAELFYAHSDDDILATVPEPLRPVIIKSCAYKREDRYDDMGALARALARVLPQLGKIPDGTAPLDDAVEALPPGPPTHVEPGALDDLRGELGLSEDGPTYVPSSKAALAHAFENQQTSLYHESSSSRVDLQDAPTVHHRPMQATAYNDDHDVSTMKPSASNSSPGLPPVPVPAGAAEAEGGTHPAVLAVGVAVGLLATIWFVAVGSNVMARWDVDHAATELVASAAIAETSLSALGQAGADANRLGAAWEAYQAQKSPEAALAFADLLASEADRVKADDLARTRIGPLTRAAEDYREAVADEATHVDSVLGKLSMGVGR